MKHRFDMGKSRTGYDQQTWVIEVEALNNAVLAEVAEYLINNVHLIYDTAKTVSEDTMWPIKIDINGQLAISEEIFWCLVCDTVPHSQDLVVSYINTLCQLAKQTKWGDLLFSDEYNFTGSFAIKPFLDRHLEHEETRTIQNMPVYDCFIEFIRRCDLDFETFQDEYIERVLGRLAFLDEGKLIELLCLRFSNGQLTLMEKDFRFLYHFLGRRPRLKKVIDYIIDSGSVDVQDYIREDEDSYLALCAAIYGDNLKETEEVMDYVRQKVGSPLRLVHPNQLNRIQRIRSECEAYRAYQPNNNQFINSSFHLYDLKNKQWLPLPDEASEAT